MILPNKGKIAFIDEHQQSLDPEVWHKQLTFCSPSQQLIEEFTLSELLSFHFKFRKLISGLSIDDLLINLNFQQSRHKIIRNFSSGMKQRLKLGLALFTESEYVLLDEPTTNMDEQGIHWYQENILKLLNDRSVIVSSNQKHEYEYCENHIHLLDFKPKKKLE